MSDTESFQFTPAIRAAIRAVAEKALIECGVASTKEELGKHLMFRAAPLCFQVALQAAWEEEPDEEQMRIAAYRSLRMLHERDGEPAIIS